MEKYRPEIKVGFEINFGNFWSWLPLRKSTAELTSSEEVKPLFSRVDFLRGSQLHKWFWSLGRVQGGSRGTAGARVRSRRRTNGLQEFPKLSKLIPHLSNISKKFRIWPQIYQTYDENHRFSNPFWINFWTLGRHGATLGSQRLRCAFQASIFKDFVSNWGPIGDPKITLGASRWPSELPKTSFGGDFVRTYLLHEIWFPKLMQKVVFFGPVDVAKTW